MQAKEGNSNWSLKGVDRDDIESVFMHSVVEGGLLVIITYVALSLLNIPFLEAEIPVPVPDTLIYYINQGLNRIGTSRSLGYDIVFGLEYSIFPAIVLGSIFFWFRLVRRAKGRAVKPSGELRTMRNALRELRHESYKAAYLHAVVYSATALVVIDFVFSAFSVKEAPNTVEVPDILIFTAKAVTLGRVPFFEYGMTIQGGRVIAVVCAFFVFWVVLGLRLWRNDIEKFESSNPSVEEALRTARDSSEDGKDDIMARLLYDDVLERLRSTSSSAYVSNWRIFVNILLIISVSIAGFYVSMYDMKLNSEESPLTDAAEKLLGGNNQGKTETSQTQPQQYQGLQAPADVLGGSEDVESGSEDISISLDESGQSGVGEGNEESSYTSGEFSSGNIESQRAGFESGEEIEDSDLVKEYNLRIRNGEAENENENQEENENE